MSSNDSLEILCDTAEYLANNTLLQVILYARLVLAVVGLIFVAVLFKVQGTYLAYHSNARILLIVHHIWAILQCVGCFENYLFEVILYGHEYGDGCLYLMTTATSVAVRGPSVIFLYGQIWALASMAIERCWATARYRTYETKNTTLGICLTIIQCLLSALWFWLTIAQLDWSEMKPSPTVSSGKTSAIFSNLFSAMGIVEIVALCIFCGLLFVNKRIRMQLKGAGLTEKYQVDENVRAIRLIIPMVVTHFCCFMPTLVLIPLYMKINPSLNPRDYIIFLEITNCAPLYMNILPVVLFWRHKVLRQNFRKAMGIGVIEPPRTDGRTHEQVRHFEVLKQMWMPPSR